MAYSKTNWVNENEPALNADNLNKIETGIEDNSLQLESYGRIINELNAPEKWVSVGTTAPTDGRRVWFKKGENLFDASTIVAGDIKGVDSTKRLSSRQALWLKEGTYTFSTTQGSPLRYAISVQDVGVPPLNSYPSTYILNSGWQTASTYTFTLQSPGYVVVSFSKENNAGITISELSSFSYQLEKGSTATTYTPYIKPSINVDEELLYQKPVVLWTNPNPTSAFASQTITLNDSLANYSYYEVLYKTYKDENIGYNTGKIPTNWGTNIYGMVNANDGGVRSRMRSVTINSSTQIEISSCSLINTKGDTYTIPNDDRLIPYKILGYKE